MSLKYLKLTECINGYLYKVDGRNFSLAIFYNNIFYGIRYKFNHCFVDAEIHWDEHGTVKPLKKLKLVSPKILKLIEENNLDILKEYLLKNILIFN